MKVRGQSSWGIRLLYVVMVWYHGYMAMNLRVPEDLDRRLELLAADEHSSKSALLLQGAELILQRHGRRREITAGLEFVMSYDAELLRRLEDALQVVGRYGIQIRDIGFLASALARPATTVMGTGPYPQLAMKAAALLESVARFHSLIDGNRRTAWTLMVLMLWINGYRHDFTVDEGFALVLGVAAGDTPMETSAALISRHLVAR